ncbi:MAG TPA: hypothetical protein PKK06_03280 [Phycisphaerae bacterium]|nr:hypothetical protein [Phycisphaerae bacterium]HNU44708.1 hypothetical protein [Phycisphaerae bacterium]
MNDVVQFVEQVRLVAAEHAPVIVKLGVVPLGIVLLLLGLGIGVLGAKLARPVVTTWFIAVGAWAGWGFAVAVDLTPYVCVPIAALLIGMIGYHAFRFWVGLLMSGVLATLVVGGYSFLRLQPYMTSFETHLESILPPESEAFPPVSEGQPSARCPAAAWVTQFGGYVREQDAAAARLGSALGALAMLVGMLVGLLAARFALITSTSVLGTLLAAGGAVMLFSQWGPTGGFSDARSQALLGLAVGAFLVTSLFLQTVFTRQRSPAPADSDKPKSK